jgi:hypothetical protein
MLGKLINNFVRGPKTFVIVWFALTMTIGAILLGILTLIAL